MVDAMIHCQHTPAANETCLAAHMSFLFVLEVSKQKDFQWCIRLILTTTKVEKPIIDDDQDFSASCSNLPRGDNEACPGGSQL